MAGAAAFVLSLSQGRFRPGNIPESSDPIKLAVNEWTGQHISTHVAGEVLKRMGYNVEYVTAGYYPQMQALEDNTITATMEIWSSNIGEHYDKALASGHVEELGDLGLVPVETWYYPPYVEEKCPGLPDYKAMNACAELFSNAESFPNGRLVDYPADWGTSNVDRIKALGAGLRVGPGRQRGCAGCRDQGGHGAERSDCGDVLGAALGARRCRSEARLALPPYEAGCYEDASVGVNPDATYDCDWERGYIKKMAWKGMADKWPAAHKLLESLHPAQRRPDPDDERHRPGGQRPGGGRQGVGG